MRTRSFHAVFCLCLVVTMLASGRQVRATLGEHADSVESDRKAASAGKRVARSGNGFTVQAFESDANEVREYISASGIVFAVVWNGVAHPDLATLLGSYVDEYRQAIRQPRGQRGQRHSQVKTDRIIVEKWGHMRDLHGRAYIPALIPNGVSLDEIK